MSSVTYRPFQPSEWEAVQAFLSREGEPSDHASDVLASYQVEAWLALHGDEIVGWILTHPHRSDDGAERGFIEDLVVARSQRDQGIGRRLMEIAESHYAKRGSEGIELTVRANNEPARHLYDSLGYTTVQKRLRMRKQFQ